MVRGRSSVALAFALTLGVPSSAVADSLWTSATWPLSRIGQQHVVYPPLPTESVGYTLAAASAGDVNGDGLDDVVAGFATPPPGKNYVTFSRRDGGTIDATGTDGFRIDLRYQHRPPTAAGDTNGDGLDDVAVYADRGTQVVFGKADSTPVAADDALGDHGFTITGVDFATSVVALGDLNGDGRGDLGLLNAGRAVVVYPPADVAGTTIDASNAGPHVALVDDTAANTFSAQQIEDAGDVDGDGRRDIMLLGRERGSEAQ